ncbi:MAG: MaoC/PaaZ C-terminal domain-containing protein [Aquiluna sp.]
MASILDGLSVGDVVAEKEFSLSRDSLVRYAGASGDFNPIHYRDDVAQSVGLPGVLAHGMLTMGIAGSVVTDWCGSDLVVTSYQVRFTKPVLVDPADGATLAVVATVGNVDLGDTAPEGSIRIDLTVSSHTGEKVLGKAQMVVSPR